MKKIALPFGIAMFILFFILSFFSFKIIDTGNVGVKKTFGVIDQTELLPGVNFKLPIITSVMEASVKEIPVEMEDLTPKAKDNLSLKDLDITVYYKPVAQYVSNIISEYAAGSEKGGGVIYPAYNLVLKEARKSTYSSVAEIDSLDLHKQRSTLTDSIFKSLSDAMEKKLNGYVEITRVVIRAINTDESIEESIREAIASQKRLDAKNIQVKIAEKDAEIRIEEAEGIAEANRIIDSSLTKAYLQHEQNIALQKFAEDGKNNTVVIPANFGGSNLLINAGAGKVN